ncbi:MAG: UTP--glucose-1-phosphate uridylyltransferase, partial [Candidatus Omnitrophica bacterium]|nr:UTP--glucose-1-phosphate uridylyltransferase [Candidatus Omnitrophota bacterium]
MRKDNTKIAALVTGGFHTEGITDVLKNRKTSYLVLIPKFDENAPKRPYVAILTKKITPYQELLDTGRYQLATSSHFAGGVFNVETTVDWVESLVRQALQRAYDRNQDLHDLEETGGIWVDAYRAVQNELRQRGRLKVGLITPQVLEGLINKFIAERQRTGRWFERERLERELKKKLGLEEAGERRPDGRVQQEEIEEAKRDARIAEAVGLINDANSTEEMRDILAGCEDVSKEPEVQESVDTVTERIRRAGVYHALESIESAVTLEGVDRAVGHNEFTRYDEEVNRAAALKREEIKKETARAAREDQMEFMICDPIVTGMGAGDVVKAAYKYNQDHIFRFWPELTDEQKELLLRDIMVFDFKSFFEEVVPAGEAQKERKIDESKITPERPLTEKLVDKGNIIWTVLWNLYNKLRFMVWKIPAYIAYRKGEYGVCLLAGGSGSRLGVDTPKGCFEASPLSEKTLYQIFVENIKAQSRRYGRPVPLIIQTSEDTHDDTIGYFEENNYFGIEDQVYIIKQRSFPPLDENGKMVMLSNCAIALGGYGHGDAADYILRNPDLRRWLRDNFGTKYIQVAQIDNPLVPIGHKGLLGAHIASYDQDAPKGKVHMTFALMNKKSAVDKLGNLGHINGERGMIEYIDVSPELAARFAAGSPNILIISLKTLDDTPLLVPHVAGKKVTNLHGDEIRVSKYETFIFDHSSYGASVEMDRNKVFASIKYRERDEDGGVVAEGRITSQSIQSLYYGRQLRSLGWTGIPEEFTYGEYPDVEINLQSIEFSAIFSQSDRGGVRTRVGRNGCLKPQGSLYLSGRNTRLGRRTRIDGGLYVDVDDEENGVVEIGDNVTFEGYRRIKVYGNGRLIIPSGAIVTQDITIYNGEIVNYGEVDPQERRAHEAEQFAYMAFKTDGARKAAAEFLQDGDTIIDTDAGRMKVVLSHPNNNPEFFRISLYRVEDGKRAGYHDFKYSGYFSSDSPRRLYSEYDLELIREDEHEPGIFVEKPYRRRGLGTMLMLLTLTFGAFHGARFHDIVGEESGSGYLERLGYKDKRVIGYDGREYHVTAFDIRGFTGLSQRERLCGLLYEGPSYLIDIIESDSDISLETVMKEVRRFAISSKETIERVNAGIIKTLLYYITEKRDQVAEVFEEAEAALKKSKGAEKEGEKQRLYDEAVSQYLLAVSLDLKIARAYAYISVFCDTAESAGYEDEALASIKEAFGVHIKRIEQELKLNKIERHIPKDIDVVTTEMPARNDFAHGGAADLPDIAHSRRERAMILNMAVRINGEKPIKVIIRPLAKPIIRLQGKTKGELLEGTPKEGFVIISDKAGLLDYREGGGYALLKAAIIASGIVPDDNRELREILEEFGGGFELMTSSNVPKGSGLAISSALGEAIIYGLFMFAGVPEEIINKHIVHYGLYLEQMLGIGGGSQDLIGPLLGGVKIMRFKERSGEFHGDFIDIKEEATIEELERRGILFYSGDGHLAGEFIRQWRLDFLLRRKEPFEMRVRLEEMLMSEDRKENMMHLLEDGDIDGFGEKMREFWEVWKVLNKGAATRKINMLFKLASFVIVGGKMAGAGGGGFGFMILKEDGNRIIDGLRKGYLRFLLWIFEMKTYDWSMDKGGLRASAISVDEREPFRVGDREDTRPTQSLAANLFTGRYARLKNLPLRILLFPGTIVHEIAHILSAKSYGQQVEWKWHSFFTGNISGLRGPPRLAGEDANYNAAFVSLFLSIIGVSAYFITISVMIASFNAPPLAAPASFYLWFSTITAFISVANMLTAFIERTGKYFGIGDLVTKRKVEPVRFIKDALLIILNAIGVIHFAVPPTLPVEGPAPDDDLVQILGSDDHLVRTLTDRDVLPPLSKLAGWTLVGVHIPASGTKTLSGEPINFENFAGRYLRITVTEDGFIDTAAVFDDRACTEPAQRDNSGREIGETARVKEYASVYRDGKRIWTSWTMTEKRLRSFAGCEIRGVKIQPSGVRDVGGENFRLNPFSGKYFKFTLAEDGLVDTVSIYEDRACTRPVEKDKYGKEVAEGDRVRQYGSIYDKSGNRVKTFWYFPIPWMKRYRRGTIKGMRLSSNGKKTIGMGKSRMAIKFSNLPDQYLNITITDDGFIDTVSVFEDRECLKSVTHDCNGEEIGDEDRIKQYGSIYNESGKRVKTFWNLSAREMRRYGGCTIKGVRINKSGFKKIGGEEIIFHRFPGEYLQITLTPEGLIDTVSVFDDRGCTQPAKKDSSGKDITQEDRVKEYALIYDKNGKKILKTFRRVLRTRLSQYAGCTIKRVKIPPAGARSIGGKQGRPLLIFGNFAGDYLEIHIAEGGAFGKMRLTDRDGKSIIAAAPGRGRVSTLNRIDADYRDYLVKKFREAGMTDDDTKMLADAVAKLRVDSVRDLRARGLINVTEEENILYRRPFKGKSFISAMKETIEQCSSDPDLKRILFYKLITYREYREMMARYKVPQEVPLHALHYAINQTADSHAWLEKYLTEKAKAGTLDPGNIRFYNPEAIQTATPQEIIERLRDERSAQVKLLGTDRQRGRGKIEYTSVARVGDKFHFMTRRVNYRPGEMFEILDEGENPVALFVFHRYVKGGISAILVDVVGLAGEGETAKAMTAGKVLFPQRGFISRPPRFTSYEVTIDMLDELIERLEDRGTTGSDCIDTILGLTHREAATDESVIGRDSQGREARMRKTPAFRERISQDLSQLAAVRLAHSSLQTLLEVQGPFGAGKTEVLSFLARLFVENGLNVLIASHENQAVNNAAARIKREDKDMPVLRLANNPAVFYLGNVTLKEMGEVWSGSSRVRSEFRWLRRRQPNDAAVFCATNVGINTSREMNDPNIFQGEEFDVIMIDEASRDTLAGTLLALRRAKPNAIVILIGDRNQLSVFMPHDLIKLAGLTDRELATQSSSALDYLSDANRGDFIMLSTSWRPHPVLAGLGSELYYEGKVNKRGWEPLTPHTLKLIDTTNKGRGKYKEKGGREESFSNEGEAEEALDELIDALRRGFRPEEITCLSFYTAQVELIREKIEIAFKMGRLRGIDEAALEILLNNVTTVASFIGGENRKIILSLTRSRGLGIVEDRKGLCVAMTRAIDEMTIIGAFGRLTELSRDTKIEDIFPGLLDYYKTEVIEYLKLMDEMHTGALQPAAVDTTQRDQDTTTSQPIKTGRLMQYAKRGLIAGLCLGAASIIGAIITGGITAVPALLGTASSVSLGYSFVQWITRSGIVKAYKRSGIEVRAGPDGEDFAVYSDSKSFLIEIKGVKRAFSKCIFVKERDDKGTASRIRLLPYDREGKEEARANKNIDLIRDLPPITRFNKAANRIEYLTINNNGVVTYLPNAMGYVVPFRNMRGTARYSAVLHERTHAHKSTLLSSEGAAYLFPVLGLFARPSVIEERAIFQKSDLVRGPPEEAKYRPQNIVEVVADVQIWNLKGPFGPDVQFEDVFSGRALEEITGVEDGMEVTRALLGDDAEASEGARIILRETWQGTRYFIIGAGMIPALSWVLTKMGIDLKWQALIEQVIFWGINIYLGLSLPIPNIFLGGLVASAITWGAFLFLHIIGRRAPPLKLTAINAISCLVTIPFLNIPSLVITALTIPIIIAAFGITTRVHYIASLEFLERPILVNIFGKEYSFDQKAWDGIERADKEDAEVITELHKEAARAAQSQGIRVRPVSAEKIREKIDTPNQYYLVYRGRDGKIRGYCHGFYDESIGGIYLSGIAVEKDYRRRGIGRALQGAFLKWMEDDFGYAKFEADPHSWGAIRLLEEFGFKRVSMGWSKYRAEFSKTEKSLKDGEEGKKKLEVVADVQRSKVEMEDVARNVWRRTFKYVDFSGVFLKEMSMEGDIYSSAQVDIEYRPNFNVITIEIRGKDKERLDRGLDEALIKIVLTRDKRIDRVEFIPTIYGLSRSSIAIILSDEGIPDRFPELYNILKYTLTLPKADNDLKVRECITESTLPLYEYLGRAATTPDSITESEIEEILSGKFYKSLVVRRVLIMILEKLKQVGRISDKELISFEQDTLAEDIREDLLFIERILKNDDIFVNVTLQKLFNLDLHIRDVDSVEIAYFDRGRNKQIYKVTLHLKTGEKVAFAMSSIRDDTMPTGGYDFGKINASLTKWQILSDLGNTVCKLGASTWIKDYRPKNLGQEVFYNNIMIVSREFVEGRDFGQFLSTNPMPDEIKAATRKVIETYLLTWIQSRDEDGRGIYLGDPKPKNIVIRKEGNDYIAKIIDLDALHDGGTIDKITRLLDMHYKDNPYYTTELISEILAAIEAPQGGGMVSPSDKVFGEGRSVLSDSEKGQKRVEVVADVQVWNLEGVVGPEVARELYSRDSVIFEDIFSGRGLAQIAEVRNKELFMRFMEEGETEITGMAVTRALLSQDEEAREAAREILEDEFGLYLGKGIETLLKGTGTKDGWTKEQLIETWQGTKCFIIGAGVSMGETGEAVIRGAKRYLQSVGLADIELIQAKFPGKEAGFVGTAAHSLPYILEEEPAQAELGVIAIDFGRTKTGVGLLKVDPQRGTLLEASDERIELYSDEIDTPSATDRETFQDPDREYNEEEQREGLQVREGIVDTIARQIIEGIEKARQEGLDVSKHLGVSSPGEVDDEGYLVGSTDYLPFFQKKDGFCFKKAIEARLEDLGYEGYEVHVVNDGTAAGLGNIRFGLDFAQLPEGKYAYLGPGSGLGSALLRVRDKNIMTTHPLGKKAPGEAALKRENLKRICRQIYTLESRPLERPQLDAIVALLRGRDPPDYIGPAGAAATADVLEGGTFEIKRGDFRGRRARINVRVVDTGGRTGFFADPDQMPVYSEVTYEEDGDIVVCNINIADG